MQTTTASWAQSSSTIVQERLEDELATLAAHINAATAKWLALVLEFRRQGGAPFDGCERWLAWRCGLSTREARECVRVADALAELPLIRQAFHGGELTFTKVRALTRVATPRSEQGLLDLAGALTASQLERALRVYRRVSSEEARDTHELEYVDYYWAEDGSLVLRARLAAEDGTLLVRALDAARERVRERQRDEQAATTEQEESAAARDFEPPRAPQVEALVELAQASLAATEDAPAPGRAQLVVHVDAASLVADVPGRCELEDGPVIAPETARRLACDCVSVTSLEQDGLALSVGRKRRTVPPKLRRLLESRDDGCCRWPGCERRRYLDAHHRTHWAQGGETSVDNLLLLCWQHHRLVHEGGYTIDDTPNGGLRFRNRHGVLVPSVPRSPPASLDELLRRNERAGLRIEAKTNRNGYADEMNLVLAVEALASAVG